MYKLVLLTLFIALTSAGCSSTKKLFLTGEAPQVEYTAQIPFTRTLKLIVVEVEMGGEPRRFMFDTGAPMVVSEELAKEFDMKVVTTVNVGDSNGKERKQEFVRMPEFAIGSQTFGGFTAVVVDLDLSPVIACLDIDGIIGANVMCRAHWKIDYEDQVLYFSNVDEFIPEVDDATVIPFRTKASFTPVVDLMIDSALVEDVTFDTGSASAVSISRDRVPNFKAISENAMVSYGYISSGIYGTTADTAHYFQAPVSIGESTVPNMLMSVQKNKGKALLGTSYFDDFDLVLNWKQKQAYLIPRSDSVDMTLRSLGLSFLKRDDQLIIGSVTLGKQADKAGLTFSDRVLEFNGIDCSTITPEQFCEIRSILDQKDGPVTITVENKGEFTLKWEKYL
jgi:predicted aspartyl protease